MKAAGTQHFIERTYREGGPFQWVRETHVNAQEADATRIHYSVEWQAVASLGVYRRVIADNGKGMTADELVEFFNTFGGGGKPIGGAHENFGVGSKTSLLPWNRSGIVVVSWVDSEAAMIWLEHDAASGEYGLRLHEVVDPATGETRLDEVCMPYQDGDHGCDWSLVKPDFIEDHGTVIVLLGNSPTDDTVLGDPNRPESDIKGISSYLNRRLWETPAGTRVTVDELRTNERGAWPRSEEEGHGPPPKTGIDRRTNLRSIEGARFYIEYPVPTFGKGKLGATGTVTLADGTEIDWYLWSGERPAVQSYAALSGYIAGLYSGELYDVTAHHSMYRSFGVSEGSVRRSLWLIIRPPVLDADGRHGVYPRTDRNALLLKGGPNAGGPLPLQDWAAEFADQMPDAIVTALKAARGGPVGTMEDALWRERLAERFGSRWRIAKLRARKGGELTVDPAQGGQPARPLPAPRRTRGGAPGSTGRGAHGRADTGSTGGPQPAARVKVGGGIPTYRFVHADAVGEGMLAAWQPNDPLNPQGVVLINVDHPVLRAEVEHWQVQYADHHAEAIEADVLKVYGEVAVAKVAHSEHLKGLLPSKIVDDDLRSEASLTMSLLGLFAEEAVIATRIGGKYGKRRATS